MCVSPSTRYSYFYSVNCGKIFGVLQRHSDAFVVTGRRMDRMWNDTSFMEKKWGASCTILEGALHNTSLSGLLSIVITNDWNRVVE